MKRKARPRKRPRARPSAPLVPQPHGGALQVGNPGNKGGTGRPPDEFMRQLRGIRDEHGLRLLREILSNTVEYTLQGRCSHCGKVSKGPDEQERKAIVAAPLELRLKAADMTLKYTVPRSHEVDVSESLAELLARSHELADPGKSV